MDHYRRREHDERDKDPFEEKDHDTGERDDEDIPPEEPPLEDFYREEIEDAGTVKKKKSKRRWMKLGIIFVSFLLVIQGTTSLIQLFQPDVVDFLATSYELSQDEDVAEWRESVVTLEVEKPGQTTRGTGFFIHEDGLIATNRHVVEDALQTVVTLHDGSAYEATPVSQSEDVDLALIRIEEDVAVDPLQLQSEEDVEEGTYITIIGNPLNFSGIANEGEIIESGNPTAISAPTYRGNSGSPAINEEGDVVGVIFATRHQPRGQGGSVGLMVPVGEVWRHIQEIGEEG
ncbi:trypsin-like peptidase domain-containing protein [Salicibibacter cibarius]|uniref:Trypsin-like peptidase domain-containing protein n=1 Tax=Salicibibacter cibarius TaxID=2743000 RepID=A0A7T7CBP4_9BACI|nr:serine protease [Salicibibacter cibarius]QQK76098.1 trypsin-like peptidase domain-containing protein [Salicibibacter cibarius]